MLVGEGNTDRLSHEGSDALDTSRFVGHRSPRHAAGQQVEETRAPLLERRDIEQVRPERGRFRTFLLASVKHFLLNEAARGRAAKRGSPDPILEATTIGEKVDV